MEKIVTSDINYDEVILYQSSLIRSDIPFKQKALYLNNLSMDYDENGLLTIDNTHNVLPGIDDLIPNKPILPSINTLKIGNDLVFETNGGGGGESPLLKLPIKSCNEKDVSAFLNDTSGGETFLGLKCNREVCKWVYNHFALKLNEFIHAPKGSLNYMIASELITLLTTHKTPLEIYTMIKTSILSSRIVEFVKTMISSLKTTIVGKIIAVICGLVVACVVAVVLAMVICGSRNLGFRVGWIIRGIFNWEWVAEYI